jgi:hypothetical protein
LTSSNTSSSREEPQITQKKKTNKQTKKNKTRKKKKKTKTKLGSFKRTPAIDF